MCVWVLLWHEYFYLYHTSAYSQAKCFLKAKCFGTRFPLNNSWASEDILTPFGQLEALIDDTVDTQAQWSGYTSYRETGQCRIFVIFFPGKISAKIFCTTIFDINWQLLMQKAFCPKQWKCKMNDKSKVEWIKWHQILISKFSILFIKNMFKIFYMYSFH